MSHTRSYRPIFLLICASTVWSQVVITEIGTSNQTLPSETQNAQNASDLLEDDLPLNNTTPSRICQDSVESISENCIGKEKQDHLSFENVTDSMDNLTTVSGPVRHRDLTLLATTESVHSADQLKTEDRLMRPQVEEPQINSDKLNQLTDIKFSTDLAGAEYSQLGPPKEEQPEQVRATISTTEMEESSNKFDENDTVFGVLTSTEKFDGSQTSFLIKQEPYLPMLSLMDDGKNGAASTRNKDGRNPDDSTEPTIEVFQVGQVLQDDLVSNSDHGRTQEITEDGTKSWNSEGSVEEPTEDSSLPIKNVAKESCYQQPIIQPCSEDTFRQHPPASTWYYDPVEMVCHLTSDCITNANAFPSEEDCKSTCVPLSGIRRCLAPPKAGYFHCSQQNPSLAVAPILMVFFDKTTGKCRWFTYYGCGGTANRFRSIAECEATCNDLIASKIFLAASDLCQTAPTLEIQNSWPTVLPGRGELGQITNTTKATVSQIPSLYEDIPLHEATMIESGCANVGQMESRWYLDVTSGVCKEFAYSHCGGSTNNFLARTDCEQFCAAKKEDPAAICRQLPDKGQCGFNHTMWYFDPNAPDVGNEIGKGTCRTFAYTGCAGNSNRFTTQADCLSTCGAFKESFPLEDLKNDQDGAYEDSASEAKEDPVETSKGVSSRDLDQSARKDKTRKIDPLTIDLEPCRRAPEAGRCRPLNCSANLFEKKECEQFNFQRWFFNAHTSNCEPFNYTGCGGSENTFDDADSCHSACKARIVRPDRDQRCDSLPHQTKCYTLSLSGTPGTEQKDNVIAFHFSVASSTCKAFQLDTTRPGCSMKPYFSNGQECIRACVKSTPTERHLQNRCFARKTHSTGNCSTGQDKIYRWSYLSELNQCVRFSQCESQIVNTLQPGNNFATRAICETTCMATSLEEVCQLPSDPGPCRANHARYYYDTKTAQCRLFVYGGCLGNANRFVTRQECQAACAEFPTRVIMTSNGTGILTGWEPDRKVTANEAESEPQSISVEVFDRMWRITQHHTDHFPWDLCLESHSYGTCPNLNDHHKLAAGYPHVQLTRYFYDRRLGKCQPFTYTGCGARGNHFDTTDACKTVCEDRLRNPKGARCSATGELKLCPGSGLNGWSFNQSTGDCQFIELCPNPETEMKSASNGERLRQRRTNNKWQGIWQAKNGALTPGVYATRSACQYHCLPKPPRGTDAQNVCHMNPIVTVPVGCNAMVTRWYFDPREATCRSYVTCPQYGNNFPSERVCLDICAPTQPLQVCRQPLDLGGCSQFITRWHYDLRTRSCRPFYYGGCFGNSNRFLSKAECDSMCTAQDVCRQPVQKTSSDVTYPKRYYFNQSSQTCESFHFTGMLAHGNNFPTMEACNATCLSVPNIDAIQMPESTEPRRKQQQSEDQKQQQQQKQQQLSWSDRQTSITETKRPTAARDGEPTLDDDKKPKYPVIGVNLMNKTTFQSPCLTPLSTMGASELDKQTICDPEDIIRELGYRFRAIENSDTANGGQVEGICELTLVPICLSEPKLVFGGIVDPRMRTIGRVFQTQAECEKTCLNSRRRRRSAMDEDEAGTAEDYQLESLVESILEKSGYETDEVPTLVLRNGCSPEHSNAEQVDRFRHDFQVFTRWPCKFDNEQNRNLVPLIERLSGKDVLLPCWILSADEPRVRWIRLKDKKSYSVAAIKIPALNSIWMAPLRLNRVHPLRHNGVWSCEATNLNEQRVMDQLVQLHVIPRTFDRPHGHPRVKPITERVVHVPEGGTLFLACSFLKPGKNEGYFYEERIKWTKPHTQHTNVSTIVLPKRREVQFLYIHPVQALLHDGPWSCSNSRGDSIRYFVEVGTAPEFTSPQSTQFWTVSKHRRMQTLHCPRLVNWGSPRGRLTWLRCNRRADTCRTVTLTTTEQDEMKLTVYPQPDDTYLCRIQNMWGRTEQKFVFLSSEYNS